MNNRLGDGVWRAQLARESVLETGPRRLSHGTSGGPQISSQRQQKSWSGGTHRRKALRTWKAAALVCCLSKGFSVPVGELGVNPGSCRAVRQEASVSRPDGLCGGPKSHAQVRVSVHIGSEAALTGSLVMVTRVHAAPTASSLEAGEPSWLSSAYVEGAAPKRVRACAGRGRA